MVRTSGCWPLIGGGASIRKTLAETRDIQVTGASKAALVGIAVGGGDRQRGHGVLTIFRDEQR